MVQISTVKHRYYLESKVWHTGKLLRLSTVITFTGIVPLVLDDIFKAHSVPLYAETKVFTAKNHGITTMKNTTSENSGRQLWTTYMGNVIRDVSLWAFVPSFALECQNTFITKLWSDQLNVMPHWDRKCKHSKMSLHGESEGQTQLFRQTTTVQDGIWAEFHVKNA